MTTYFEFNHKHDGLSYTVEVGIEGIAPSGLSKHVCESDLDYTGYGEIIEVFVHIGDTCVEVDELEKIGLTDAMIWRYHGLYMDTNEMDYDY